MRKLWLTRVLSLAALIQLFHIAPVSAVTIVDTGPGPATAGGPSLASFQWLAAEFSISQPYIITDVQGWMHNIDALGTATAAIYTDGGEIPGTELFSASFSGTPTVDWYGPSGLSWSLAAGTYWVAFEVRPGDTFYGAMPTPSGSPLANEAAVTGNSNGLYIVQDDLDMGVRIQADPVSVPEPSTLLLLAGGLAALIGFGRNRFN